MKFNLIHPSIIELYINALSLHLIQEKLSIIGPEGLTDELKDNIDEVTHNFSISSIAAEKLLGSPDIVQGQLDSFFENTGDA